MLPYNFHKTSIFLMQENKNDFFFKIGNSYKHHRDYAPEIIVYIQWLVGKNSHIGFYFSNN